MCGDCVRSGGSASAVIVIFQKHLGGIAMIHTFRAVDQRDELIDGFIWSIQSQNISHTDIWAGDILVFYFILFSRRTYMHPSDAFDRREQQNKEKETKKNTMIETYTRHQ